MREDDPVKDGSKASANRRELIEHRQLPPTEVFGVLQNEVRLAILRVLWDTTDAPITYTTLKDQTPVDTDNFHYHLEQLVGHFVRRSEDGYELLYAGEEVIRAILAGAITGAVSLEPIEIDARCPYCGSTIVLQYLDVRLTANCTGCDGVVRNEELPRGTILSYSFPPAGVLDRSPTELLEAAHVLYDAKITAMMNGVCPECAATVGQSLVVCREHAPAEGGVCDACNGRFAVWTIHGCGHCGYERQFVPWFKLLSEPAVISFYREHSDFDQSIPFSKLTWQNAPYVRSISQTVVSEEPLRIRVDMPLEDAKLSVTIDEDIEIVKLERSTPDANDQ